jgi:shikimate dehydrogenase
MLGQNDIAAVQACIANQLDPAAIGDRCMTGVIGDVPSQYSKSPTLWNAAFRALGMNAIYLPFDIEQGRLKDLTSAMRDSERILGINVTVPHKLKIMEYLDELDPGAARIQAVNTIVRTHRGRLIGYNTDGQGFVKSILKPQPSQAAPFVSSLEGMDVLLVGAGGAGRAVAFHIAELLDGGKLFICNRTLGTAEALAAKVRKIGWNARAIPEPELSTWAPRVGLIVNSTTKGQGGLRGVGNGNVTSMESYSALAPAHPVAVSKSQRGKTDSEADIQANNEASIKIATSAPKKVCFYDLIYSPEETVFLRHARLTGHRTMNGKAMIVNQAAIAFCDRICLAELQAKGIDHAEAYEPVLEAMYQAW